MSKEVVFKDTGFIAFTKNCGPISVRTSRPNYSVLLNYVRSDDYTEEVFERLFVMLSVDDLEAASEGALKAKEDHVEVTVDSEVLVLPTDIQDKVRELMSSGASWTHLENFWRRCLKNPNRGSVEQLYRFVSNNLSTIFEDGCFLAYKYVDKDYLDCYSHTYDNSPGKIVEMPRDQVTFDPNTYCSAGLHVASLNYARGNSPSTDRRIVCVKVDPADVVSVPFDYSGEKIRVCKYEVISDWHDEEECKHAVVNRGLEKISSFDDTLPTNLTMQEMRLAAAIARSGYNKHSVANLANKLGRDLEQIDKAVRACELRYRAVDQYHARYFNAEQLYRLMELADYYGNQWSVIIDDLIAEFGETWGSEINADQVRKIVHKLRTIEASL